MDLRQAAEILPFLRRAVAASVWPRLLPAVTLCGCSEVAEVLLWQPQAGGAAFGGGHDADAGANQDAGSGGAGRVPELEPSLSAGQYSNCLARDGLVYCWGNNQDGQLGVGDTEPHATPMLVPGSVGVVQVSVGENHACWLTVEGAVACFGSNAEGQLGRDDVASSATPLEVSLPEPAASIDVNYRHSCAVLTTGELFCWGENLETQLGQSDAPDENRPLPVRVPSPTPVAQVSCGQGHTLALTSDGSVLAWGRNTSGQAGLGEGLPDRVREPSLVASAVPFQLLDAGQDSACAIGEAQQLFCWGAGSYGHLGNGSDVPVWVPSEVATERTWTSVSSDVFHSCGLDANQQLYCWGRNAEGQLGLGDFEPVRLAPSTVDSRRWKLVSVGRFHTCALNVDGHVWCSGLNDHGELGDAGRERSNVFVEVSFP